MKLDPSTLSTESRYQSQYLMQIAYISHIKPWQYVIQYAPKYWHSLLRNSSKTKPYLRDQLFDFSYHITVF